MNDGKKEEDMSSPEEAFEIGGRPDVGADDDVGSAPDPGADASVLEHAETSSPDQRTTDSEQASKGVSCLAGPLGVEVPSSENGGNALDATAVDNLSIEVSSEAEGAAEPGIQLPAVVHGGPVARYAPPIPYEPHAAFLLEVERSLPPNFELDDRTGRIFTRSTTLRQIPLCGPLRVSARNRTSTGTGWSYDLQFLNLDGILCSHVVLASELLVNGRAVVARLMDLGLDVVGEPAMLAHMIRNTEVDARAVTVHAPGWTTGPNPAFVMPTGEVVAPEVPDALLRYEYQGPRWDKAAVAGRLKNWKELLAVYAVGNPAMIFAISYALLGPLLSILGIKTVGFHIYHKTSAGKSAIAAVAQSVWHSTILQGWDVTMPALEQICLASNETFCVLDELRDDPKLDLGQAIYLVFNGSNRAISAGKKKRAAENWSLALLSTGEEAAQDILAKNGPVRAGLLVRFIDVRLVRENETLYPELHGFSDSYQLVKHLEAQVALQSGTAGRAFIECLVNERPFSKSKIKALHAGIYAALRRHLGLEGQPLQGEVARVLERFAAVVTAGEVGIHAGILPWKRNDVYKTVLMFAKRWLEDRGGNVSSETGTVVARARDFLTQYGGIRFQSIDDARERRVVKDLAGWTSGEHFHVTPATFAKVFAGGMGVERAARCLFEAGYLTPGGEKGSLQNKMLSGVRDHSLEGEKKDRPRCYSIKMSILAA